MLLGFEAASFRRGRSAMKLMLSDFAVGPPVLDLTNSAFELKPAGGRALIRLVASITVLPSHPETVSNASGTAPPGTASRTAAASETSPPSRPILVTRWPARSQRSPSPPPTLPLPTTASCMPAGRMPRASRLGEDPVGGSRHAQRPDQPGVPAGVLGLDGALPLVVVDPSHAVERPRQREQELLVVAGAEHALVAVLPVAPTLYAADLGQPDLSRGQALEHPQLRGRVRADVVVVVECPDLRPV